jgi:TRAP-type transport system periplasmic protein
MITRREFLTTAAAGVANLSLIKYAQPPKPLLKQYHNQGTNSVLHKNLVEMWAAVDRETHGRFVVQTFAQNNNLPGSDPEALKMLVSGELQFFTLWGAILGIAVPVAEIQALPFVFSNRKQIFDSMDSELGKYLHSEMQTKGIYGFPGGCFENGFRQITSNNKPILNAADMVGLKIRTPDSQVFVDFFKTLGSEPLVINFGDLYEALKSGKADAQDNPLEVTTTNRFYEVQKYLSLTNHMWSGFNLLANLEYWKKIPEDIQKIIQGNVHKFVARQRSEQDRQNRQMVKNLAGHGMSVHQTNTSGFRKQLEPFYQRWRKHFGEKAWKLLESYVGKIGA